MHLLSCRSTEIDVRKIPDSETSSPSTSYETKKRDLRDWAAVSKSISKSHTDKQYICSTKMQYQQTV